MKGYRGAGVQLHSFLISALYGVEWSTSHPGRFIPRKELLYPLIGRFVGPRSRSGRFCRSDISCPYRDPNPLSSSPCLVAIPTTLNILLGQSHILCIEIWLPHLGSTTPSLVTPPSSCAVDQQLIHNGEMWIWCTNPCPQSLTMRRGLCVHNKQICAFNVVSLFCAPRAGITDVTAAGFRGYCRLRPTLTSGTGQPSVFNVNRSASSLFLYYFVCSLFTCLLFCFACVFIQARLFILCPFVFTSFRAFVNSLFLFSFCFSFFSFLTFFLNRNKQSLSRMYLYSGSAKFRRR